MSDGYRTKDFQGGDIVVRGNPKAVAATRDAKPPLDLLERSMLEATANAMRSGAVKYGKKNYRDVSCQMSTYGASMMRHILAFNDGEDIDPESGCHHLAHVAANVNVFYGSMDAGTMNDDRGSESRTGEQQELSDMSNTQHAVRALKQNLEKLGDT